MYHPYTTYIPPLYHTYSICALTLSGIYVCVRQYKQISKGNALFMKELFILYVYMDTYSDVQELEDYNYCGTLMFSFNEICLIDAY